MTAATYLPTPDQAATVALLKTPPVSIGPDWKVDSGAIDGDATEECLCGGGGWATVCGLPCPPGIAADTACPTCAVWLIEWHHTDPDWSGDVLSLDVLREPATSKENP